MWGRGGGTHSTSPSVHLLWGSDILSPGTRLIQSKTCNHYWEGRVRAGRGKGREGQRDRWEGRRKDRGKGRSGRREEPLFLFEQHL